MLILASFNGPSEFRFSMAFLGSIMLAGSLGYWLKSPSRGFKFGGLAGAGLTFAVLGSAQGDLVFYVTAFYTPVFGLISGLAGCLMGRHSSVLRSSEQPSQTAENSKPQEPQINSDHEAIRDRPPNAAP